MGDETKGLIGGIRLIYAAVGVATTLVALATDQTVVILNTFGVLGVGMMVIGVITWRSFVPSEPGSDTSLRRIKYTFGAMLVTGIVCGLLMLTGRPLDQAEREFGLLTFIGGANVVLFAAVLSLGLNHLSRIRGRTKKCPDCANDVKAEARKCQFCQYRFGG